MLVDMKWLHIGCVTIPHEFEHIRYSVDVCDAPYDECVHPFSVKARETADRMISVNTFTDMGRLCVQFL